MMEDEVLALEAIKPALYAGTHSQTRAHRRTNVDRTFTSEDFNADFNR